MSAQPTVAPTVAIIGASSDRRKYGNKAVRAHLHAGYSVCPVHPTETSVEGLPAYRTLADIPATHLDRVTLYVPPSVGLTLLESLTTKPSSELILNPGTHTPELIARAEALGLNPVTGCSILMAGVTPGMFPDE
jgi:predicted CoA-binding protein